MSKQKLSHAQVVDIRRRLAAGEMAASIARSYGVNRSTIGAYKRSLEVDVPPGSSVLAEVADDELVRLRSLRDTLSAVTSDPETRPGDLARCSLELRHILRQIRTREIEREGPTATTDLGALGEAVRARLMALAGRAAIVALVAEPTTTTATTTDGEAADA